MGSQRSRPRRPRADSRRAWSGGPGAPQRGAFVGDPGQGRARAVARGRRPLPVARGSRCLLPGGGSVPPWRMARRGGTCDARVLENELAFDLVPVAIFDMDGVLYRGSILMPQAKETLERLRRAGWEGFFAHNKATA